MNDTETRKALYANAGATAGGKLMRFPEKPKPIGIKAVAAAVRLQQADLATLMRESMAMAKTMERPR